MVEFLCVKINYLDNPDGGSCDLKIFHEGQLLCARYLCGHLDNCRPNKKQFESG